MKRLVIFAILMENNRGILAKAPLYILEKYHSALNIPYPENLLDDDNTEKLKKWLRKWGHE